MRDEDSLQLRGRHLHSLVLDQLLEPIDDVQVLVLVDEANVTAVQPALSVDGMGGGLRIVEVAFHDLRSAVPDLALLGATELSTIDRVDDAGLGIGDQAPRRPGADTSRLVWVVGRDHRTGFRQPIALGHHASQPVAAGLLQRGVWIQ